MDLNTPSLQIKAGVSAGYTDYADFVLRVGNGRRGKEPAEARLTVVSPR